MIRAQTLLVLVYLFSAVILEHRISSDPTAAVLIRYFVGSRMFWKSYKCSKLMGVSWALFIWAVVTGEKVAH